MSKEDSNVSLHGENSDNLTNTEILIKTERDEEIIFQEQERCIESTRLKSNSDNDSPKNAKQLKRSAEIDDKIEPAEISQDNDLFINTSKNKQNDSLLYGKLLTKKLRTNSMYERNLLMNKIGGFLVDNPPGKDPGIRSLPPGFKTSNSKIVSGDKPLTPIELHSKPVKPPTSNKRDKIIKVYNSTSQMEKNSPIERSYMTTTKETSTSMAPLSTVKANNSPNPVKVASSIQNQPVKVTSNILNNFLNGQSNKQYQPVNVKISSQPSQAVSVPTHLPLKITIPDNQLVISSKYVPSSYHKGKIVIMKSKSSKVSSSQPPILITVPTLSAVTANMPVPTQCSMNSLEQFSSITATHSLQKNISSFDSQESGFIRIS